MNTYTAERAYRNHILDQLLRAGITFTRAQLDSLTTEDLERILSASRPSHQPHHRAGHSAGPAKENEMTADPTIPVLVPVETDEGTAYRLDRDGWAEIGWVIGEEGEDRHWDGRTIMIDRPTPGTRLGPRRSTLGWSSIGPQPPEVARRYAALIKAAAGIAEEINAALDFEEATA